MWTLLLCIAIVQFRGNKEFWAQKSNREMESGWESSSYHMIPSVWAVDGNPSFHWCMETCAAHVCLSLSQVTAQSGKMQKISLSCASQLIPISESRRDPPRAASVQRESARGAREC